MCQKLCVGRGQSHKHSEMQRIYCFLKVRDGERDREREKERVRKESEKRHSPALKGTMHSALRLIVKTPPHCSIKRDTHLLFKFSKKKWHSENGECDRITVRENSPAENRFVLDNWPDKTKMAVMLSHSAGKKGYWVPWWVWRKSGYALKPRLYLQTFYMTYFKIRWHTAPPIGNEM